MSLREGYSLGTGTISGPLPQIHLKDTAFDLVDIGYYWLYWPRLLQGCLCCYMHAHTMA